MKKKKLKAKKIKIQREIRTLIVNSTVIDSIKYNMKTKVMKIMFKDGRLYSYSRVSCFEFASFACADSIGKCFNDNILDRHQYTILKTE